MQSNPSDVVAVGGGSVAIGARVDFDDFYRAELPRLVALARALCGGAAADDVAQEAMLAAYRRWRQVSELEHPEAWVRRACSNLAMSQYRRRLVELRAVTRLARRPNPHRWRQLMTSSGRASGACPSGRRRWPRCDTSTSWTSPTSRGRWR